MVTATTTNADADRRLMGAVVCEGAGGPEVMTWRKVEKPVPGQGEVLIRVAATAVNRADLSQRAGRYPVPVGASPILGLECSGWIESLGDEVTGVEVGAPVMALVTGGAYAEFVAVPVGQLMPIPTGVSVVAAAALPEALCTVYSNLVLDASLRVGQSVLIHGGGSGIGTAAIQIANALGARPIVTVGSERKKNLCLTLGASAAINYRELDYVDEVRRLTDGAGVDVLLDCVGGPYLSRNIEALADDGTMLVIGLQGGALADIDLAPVMRRRLTVRGSTLRARPANQKTAIVDATVRGVSRFLASGQVAPVVDHRVPIKEVVDAHAYVEAGKNFGKVLLVIDDTSDDCPGAH